MSPVPTRRCIGSCIPDDVPCQLFLCTNNYGVVMIESALLIIYAAVSVGLAVWIRRAFKPKVDWSHPNMRKPVFAGNVRSSGGSGALGVADAINTAALSSASPNAVMAFIIAVAGLIGGVIGAGVLPALVGGIGQPGWGGMMALVVAMLAWVWIGGTLALPMLAFAFSLIPLLIGGALLGVVGLFAWQTMNEIQHRPAAGDGKWQVAFGARVDYNLCAAGASLITLGNPVEISRKCKQRAVGPHPIEGKFAGVYSCSKGQNIAAIVEVRPYGAFRDGMKQAEMQFGDRPEVAFPAGEFSGSFHRTNTSGEFRSNDLKWTQKPGPQWGKPDGLSITANPAGGISVQLMNTPCSVMQAKRCQASKPGQVPTCETEFAQQGVKLRRAATMKEWWKELEADEARRIPAHN